jgi:hypothetical protein
VRSHRGNHQATGIGEITGHRSSMNSPLIPLGWPLSVHQPNTY